MLCRFKKYVAVIPVFLMLSGSVLTVLAAEAGTPVMQDANAGDTMDVFTDGDGNAADTGNVTDTENIAGVEETADPVPDLPPEDTPDPESGDLPDTVSGNSAVAADPVPDPAVPVEGSVSGNSSGIPAVLIPPTVVNHYATYNTTVAEEKEEYTFLEKPFEEYTVVEGFLLLIFLLLCFRIFMDFAKWRYAQWHL